MKLFGSTKNGENVQSLEVVEVVLVQCKFEIVNINKILKYYTLLRPINLMLIC